MTETQKIDYVLLALYKQTKDGGMLGIVAAITAHKQILNIKELKTIKLILESKKYAIFQIEKLDYRGQITEDGVLFVERDSFSSPGTPILDLESK